MRYLLDTHVALWFLIDPEKISSSVKNILEDSDNEIVLSAVSFWEISIKFQSKKLYLNTMTPRDVQDYFSSNQFTIVDLNSSETSSFWQLSVDYHRDPFDRILIWQAIQNNLTLITDDENIKKYESEGLKWWW
jgi:PIN domain nuclease of toxin-antitoxin system